MNWTTDNRNYVSWKAPHGWQSLKQGLVQGPVYIVPLEGNSHRGNLLQDSSQDNSTTQQHMGPRGQAASTN